MGTSSAPAVRCARSTLRGTCHDENHYTSEESEQTLTERLALISITDIEVMSGQEVPELMDAAPEEAATEPTWTWREAAKTVTDEYIACHAN